MADECQLISYIAPAAPATRRPATGDEPFLRAEFGFTPKWYHEALGIDFSARWHIDPAYRQQTIMAMRSELKRRFPDTSIARIDEPDLPPDLLTGTYGACTIAGIYGVPIRYEVDNWPTCEPQYLTDEQVDSLDPPDLDNNSFFENLMHQVDWIAREVGNVEGFINWQGVLNNAHRLRGQQLFIDFFENPDRARHLFRCVCATMMDAARRLNARKKETGSSTHFFTISNCLVNLISPQCYCDFLLPFDQHIAASFGCLGLHNCAWNADPYLDAYAGIQHLGYIDLGIDSDLKKTRELFPHARRAIMYTPMDLANKSPEQIQADLERIAAECSPCDIVAADIESGTPDARVQAFHALCCKISDANRVSHC